MAGYGQIATVSRGVLSVLADARAGAGFGSARCELYSSASFREPMDDGVSLYLLNVATSTRGRSQPAPRGAPERPASPLRVDVTYLLTAWSRLPERQQVLLAWAMSTLEDSPVLPGGLLNSCAADAGPPPFRPGEAVELALEPMTIDDLSAVWTALGASPQPSVACTARGVPVRALRADEGPRPARIGDVRLGSGDTP